MRVERRRQSIAAAAMLVLLPLAAAHGQRVVPNDLRTPRLGDARALQLTLTWSRQTPRPAATLATTPAPATRRAGYARYALWGAGIGAAVGLGVGTYSNRHNNSGCTDCFVGDGAVPLFGTLVGATAGFLVGSIAYLGTRPSALGGHRALSPTLTGRSHVTDSSVQSLDRRARVDWVPR